MKEVQWVSIKTKPGGIDSFVKNLSNSLKSKDYNLVIEKLNRIFEFFPFILIFKKLKSEIIFSNLEFSWVFKRKNKILVGIMHHNVFDQQNLKLSSPIQRMYYYLILYPNLWLSVRLSDKIVCVSDYTKKSMINMFPLVSKKIQTIYNGIDTDYFYYDANIGKNKQKIIFYSGNLSRRKGTDILVKIAENTPADWKFYSTSNPKNEVYKSKKINYLGKLSREKLRDMYQKSTIFVFPSRFEGFGLSVVEAMSCGSVVIAFKNSSIPEIVLDGKTGLLCENESHEQIISKINFIIKNPDKILKIKNYGVKYSNEKFNLKIMAENYAKLVENLK